MQTLKRFACLVAGLLVGTEARSSYPPTPGSVVYEGSQLMVDGQPFFMKGICYSPVPTGETVEEWPFGDYFTPDYAYMWKRDLPLIAATGANVIRTYGWDTSYETEHYEFLDEVHKYGLKVLISYHVGTKFEDPPVFINSEALKQVPIANFTRDVALYGDHPAILMWSFGNELNGPWNGFLDQLNELNSCGPDVQNEIYGKCWNKDEITAACLPQVTCMYKNFFGWINDAAISAKTKTTRPMTTGFADLDRIVSSNNDISRIAQFGHFLEDLDAIALQLYKGETFLSYFKKYKDNAVASAALSVSKVVKPMIVTEYGVDAYNDPCGWPENAKDKVCTNLVGDELFTGGGLEAPVDGSPFHGCKDETKCSTPGEPTQAAWDLKLSQELWDNRVKPASYTDAPTVAPLCEGPYTTACKASMDWMENNWQSKEGVTGNRCSWQAYLYENEPAIKCQDPYASSGGERISGGGFLMAWKDETWKGTIRTQGFCKFPCDTSDVAACEADRAGFEPGGARKCTNQQNDGELARAHWECTHDASYHGLCGYYFPAFPDLYMNEEWFGLNRVVECGQSVPGNDPDGQKQEFTLESLSVRPVMKELQSFWAPDEFAKNEDFAPLTCEQMLPCWQCIQQQRQLGSPSPIYLNACKAQCDLSVTTAAPTTAAPTTAGDTPSPTSLTPTASAAPTFSMPPTSTLPPTPLGVPKTAWVLLTEVPQLEETTTIEIEFIDELELYLGIENDNRFANAKAERAAGTAHYIKFDILPCASCGIPSAQALYNYIQERFDDLTTSSDGNVVLQKLDTKFALSDSRPAPPTPNGPSDSAGAGQTIALVVAGVVLVFAGVMLYCCYSKKKSQVPSYQISDETTGDYVAPVASTTTFNV